jgi:mRNA interferase RelE/StbE
LGWTIDYTETAKRQLRKLDKSVARRIVEFMDKRVAMQEDPHKIDKVLTGPMLGAYWRYRVGDYRVICDIQNGALCILVIELENRGEVYR